MTMSDKSPPRHIHEIVVANQEEKKEMIDHIESRRENDSIGENPKYIELALKRFTVNDENRKEVK